MGDRGQVLIKGYDGGLGVCLYTHYGARTLPSTVKAALAKKWRWDDREYLARIIFDTMTEGKHGMELGYGIGTEVHKDVWRLVIVDCDKMTVTIEDWGKPVATYTFDEFIETSDETLNKEG